MDNIPLKQDSIYNQSLKTEETIGYQCKKSNSMDKKHHKIKTQHQHPTPLNERHQKPTSNNK